MNRYLKYDIASKVTLVEEFLTRRQNGEKLTIIAYSFEKQIPKTTFADWLYKYKNSKNAFINGASASDDTIDLSPVAKPTFIEISKDKIVDKINSSTSIPTNTIKLNYKDASIEFSANELDKVMEILKRW